MTNSERGFLWFADNDKGWITDDDRSHPTQEIKRVGDTVVLRVYFIEVPTELKAATTLEYGYQAFPSRPLPEGWRSIICSNTPADLPDARNTYFWFDGDWAVLWPYYCSPYAWDFEKSRKLFERTPTDSNHRPMVGSIAHSIGRYRDYEGNMFNEYAVDWGETPGDLGNANVTQDKGPVDFRLFHYREWVRKSGFRGLYIDENYLSFDRNFLSGGAYIRPDGRLQVGYDYLGLREYFKRMKIMFHEEKVAAPNLWQHISSGSAYHSWFGDVFFEGENVEPTDLDFDYIRVLPAERMRSIGSSRCSGGAMTMMCQSMRHASVHEPKHTHQFVGWVMAHDIIPEQVREYNIMAQAAQFWRKTEFLPYWRPDSPFKTAAKDTMVSAHRNSERTMLWIVNTSRKDQNVAVAVDWAAAGLKPATAVAIDAETGQRIALTAQGFAVPVLNRDYVAVHLQRQDGDDKRLSFRASFDDGTTADYAYGAARFLAGGRPEGTVTRAEGVKGKGLAVADGVTMLPHLSLTDTQGALKFDALVTDNPNGTIIQFTATDARNPLRPPTPAIELAVERDDLIFGVRGQGGWDVELKVTATALKPGWHQVEIAWAGGKMTLYVDGQAVGSLPVERLNICSTTGKAMLESGGIVFGGRRSAVSVVDNITCYRD